MRIEKIRMRHCILFPVKSKLMPHVKTLMMMKVLVKVKVKSAKILQTLLVMTMTKVTMVVLKWR